MGPFKAVFGASGCSKEMLISFFAMVNRGQKRQRNAGLGRVLIVLAAAQAAGAPAVALVKDGKAQMPILAGSVKFTYADLAARKRFRTPAKALPEELQEYIEAISGARWKIEPAKRGASGIYVGLASDFPWVEFKDVDALGAEGFILRTDETNVYLVAKGPRGVPHAVATFLQMLGCR